MYASQQLAHIDFIFYFITVPRRDVEIDYLSNGSLVRFMSRWLTAFRNTQLNRCICHWANGSILLFSTEELQSIMWISLISALTYLQFDILVQHFSVIYCNIYISFEILLLIVSKSATFYKLWIISQHKV